MEIINSISSPGSTETEPAIPQAGELEGAAVVEQLEFEKFDVVQ